MANKIKSILKLLRVQQYYKNGLVFVGAFFAEKLLDFSIYISLIIGFILLCCASSFNYIINDLKDIESDKKHPEKAKEKPLASGDISIPFAVFILVVLIAIIVVAFIFVQNWGLLLMILLVIITGQVYNHFLKKIAFVDILILSMGYLWRALAGCYIIDEFISAWLFLAIFEVALFLVIAKRKGDLLILGDKNNAIEHKKVYNQYSVKLLEQFHMMIAACLFMTYSLYLILTFNLFSAESAISYEYVSIFSVPIGLYIIMRYLYLTSAKPEIARNTEKAFFDKGIIIAGILMGGILSYSFYFEQLIEFLNFIF